MTLKRRHDDPGTQAGALGLRRRGRRPLGDVTWAAPLALLPVPAEEAAVDAGTVGAEISTAAEEAVVPVVTGAGALLAAAPAMRAQALALAGDGAAASGLGWTRPAPAAAEPANGFPSAGKSSAALALATGALAEALPPALAALGLTGALALALAGAAAAALAKRAAHDEEAAPVAPAAPPAAAADDDDDDDDDDGGLEVESGKTGCMATDAMAGAAAV